MIVHDPPDRLARLIAVQANNTVDGAGHHRGGVMLISELPLLRRERELPKYLVHKFDIGTTGQLADSGKRHFRSVLTRSATGPALRLACQRPAHATTTDSGQNRRARTRRRSLRPQLRRARGRRRGGPPARATQRGRISGLLAGMAISDVQTPSNARLSPPQSTARATAGAGRSAGARRGSRRLGSDVSEASS
jgi:hypothetical protein